MSLLPLVSDFLQSADFKILEEGKEHLVADKLVFQQERDTWLIWTVPPKQQLDRYEPILNASISNLRPKYPDAKAYVVAQSRSGLSRPLQRRLTDEGIRFSVPAQFFDTPFSVEETSHRTQSVISQLRSLGTSEARVPQPFFRPGVEEDAQGDLCDRLMNEVGKLPDAPFVRVVVGRAGIGKSSLFRALFASAYKQFLAAKSALHQLPRPIPLVPEHLKDIYALRTELMVDNFLRTDVASPVGRNTFEWLLVNGFATWLLDGLDELYTGDPGFFDGYLAELLTRPGSKAQITIFSRDSLLTTSDAFLQFRDLCGESAMSIYHLREWDRTAKRHFAWLRFSGTAPVAGQVDPPKVCSFLKRLDDSNSADLLAGLPFYCGLLLDQHHIDVTKELTDETALLEYMIDQMLQREIKKELIDIRMFEVNGLRDWLEQIAANYVDNRYADIDQSEASEYGQLVLRSDVELDVEKHLLTSLLQFPFFRAGESSGRIGFAHDLIAESLAAPVYVKRLKTNPNIIARRLATVDLNDPTLLRFMAAKIDGHGAIVVKALERTSGEDQSNAALLSLLLLTSSDRDLLKRLNIQFSARNLSGVRFVDRDLSGLSLRQADLSHATFVDCDLTDAKLEGAHLHRTRFEDANQLAGADFGDLGRVQSLIIAGKMVDDSSAIRNWILAQTGRPQTPTDSCPAGLQVVHMFGKFIKPLGQARRDDLTRVAILAGKRYAGAPSPQECLDSLVTEGYLTGPDNRHRFKRAAGDRYSEMVSLVRDRAVGAGLGGVIARLCRRRGCLHQLGGRIGFA